MNKTLEHSAAVKNGVGRMIFAALSMVVEALFIFLILVILGSAFQWVIVAVHLGAVFIVLYIYSRHITPSMKMPWIVLLLVLPVFGLFLYLLIGLSGTTSKMRKEYTRVDDRLRPLLPDNKSVNSTLRQEDARLANLAYYISRDGYPLYDDTDVVYYDDGLKGLEAQKEDLRKAEKFIFMEYHAIEDLESWRGIQEILEEKAKKGVEVRVFYDDMGSIGFITTDFVKRLEAVGIKCMVFNAFSPGLNIFVNNRDHRKITVIDGKVGFTGGYNLANEYFHVTEPYGFWKDTGIRLEGPAVNSLTSIFLEMWNAVAKPEYEDKDLSKFFVDHPNAVKRDGKNGIGYIQPYADSPLDESPMGENVYISMAELATDYVWFVTPYLIITDEMTRALTLAANRGVDVRIITPGIPDKKIVYSVTRSYYNALVAGGVRVYEYTPGFCHAKMCVCDDVAATCGTINMDYRSLYHHFENGCLMMNCDAVTDVRKDFEGMIKESRDVTEYYKTGRGAFLRFGQLILRLVAPLL